MVFRSVPNLIFESSPKPKFSESCKKGPFGTLFLGPSEIEIFHPFFEIFLIIFLFQRNIILHFVIFSTSSRNLFYFLQFFQKKSEKIAKNHDFSDPPVDPPFLSTFSKTPKKGSFIKGKSAQKAQKRGLFLVSCLTP